MDADHPDGSAYCRGRYYPYDLQLFNMGKTGGAYWYWHGINPRALIAFVPAVVIGLLFINTSLFIGPWANAASGVDLSFISAAVIAVVIYGLLLLVFPERNRRRERGGGGHHPRAGGRGRRLDDADARLEKRSSVTEIISSPPPYVDKVVEALAQGSEPHLLSGAQYLKSLADGRRVVAADGTEVGDVTTHPATQAAAETFARVMDPSSTPSRARCVTYVDDDGTRKARGWQVPTTRDHLYAKREQIGITTRETLGMFGRPPDYGPGMSLGFLAIIDRVEAESSEFAENMRQFVKMSATTICSAPT